MQRLQVGQAFEHQNAINQLIGMFHFSDRFFVLFFSDFFQAPMLIHPGMKKILVDCAEFVGELGIEQLDDVIVAFHGSLENELEKAAWSMPM